MSLEEDTPYIAKRRLVFTLDKSIHKEINSLKKKETRGYLMQHFSSFNSKIQPHIILLLARYGDKDVIYFFICEAQKGGINGFYCSTGLYIMTLDSVFMYYRHSISQKDKRSLFELQRWWNENGDFLYKKDGHFFSNQQEKKKLYSKRKAYKKIHICRFKI